MESNRGVVCLEPRKHDHGVILKSLTTNSYRGDRHIRRQRFIIMGLALSLSVMYSALPGWAQTEKAVEEPKRPALQIGSALRFNEDWSVLKGVDLSKTDDFWDRVKFIPLTQDQSVWLSFGGQARARVEYFNQFQWGASEPEQSNAYLLTRLRWSGELNVTPYFRMYIEGKSALVPVSRKLQGDNSTSFYDQNSLFNGFADIVVPFGRAGERDLARGSSGAFVRFPAAGRAGRLHGGPPYFRRRPNDRSAR